MRRKIISVTWEAGLSAFPQWTKLQKEVARFCHSLLPMLVSTLEGTGLISRQSSMHFTEEDKSNCFCFISTGSVGVLFWVFFPFVFKVMLDVMLKGVRESDKRRKESPPIESRGSEQTLLFSKLSLRGESRCGWINS